MLVTLSCLTLCNAMDGLLFLGTLWARILEWIAILHSKGSSRPRNQTQVSCIAGRLHHLSHRDARSTGSPDHKPGPLWPLVSPCSPLSCRVLSTSFSKSSISAFFSPVATIALIQAIATLIHLEYFIHTTFSGTIS